SQLSSRYFRDKIDSLSAEQQRDSSKVAVVTHSQQQKEENAQQLARQNLGTEVSVQRANALTRAIKISSPAVVSVNVIKVQEYYTRTPFRAPGDIFDYFFRMYPQQVRSIGSGFIVSDDGYVVTNEHVVLNATEIVVAMQNGKEYPAKLVGSDHVSDIALLKIDIQNAPFLRLGNSDKIIIGEWAIALGNPFGLFIKSQPTVTVGVISAINRDFSPYEGRVYQNMIQTDAAINNGNSGGPLCNVLGEVIGMNSFIYTGESGVHGNIGIGFAIPSNRIKRIIKDLKEHHGVDRDFWIGLYVNNLTDFMARRLGYPNNYGVIVVSIEHNSPAQKAGIKLGDIITKISGRKVHDADEANAIILGSDLRVGDRLKIEIWRQNKTYQKSLLLVKKR
ncbi:MAG TPA: trypsin-like serine protease, partial [Calditrichaeota bacterium]|nr:trypsin-like serine protease [Calditrichota bacterium]